MDGSKLRWNKENETENRRKEIEKCCIDFYKRMGI